MLEELPVHVDGEPWPQGPGQVVVLRSALRVSLTMILTTVTVDGRAVKSLTLRRLQVF